MSAFCNNMVFKTFGAPFWMDALLTSSGNSCPIGNVFSYCRTTASHSMIMSNTTASFFSPRLTCMMRDNIPKLFVAPPPVARLVRSLQASKPLSASGPPSS